MHHSVAKRAWFAATCKQTPAIMNFLECLKMYFAGEDMSVDENEKKRIMQEHATTLNLQPIPLVKKEFMAFSANSELKNYQY